MKSTSYSSFTHRFGLTMIELIVVIGIVGVLIALLIPAISQIRESARRSTCGIRLHQLALATHQYHDVWQCLPPGRYLTHDRRFWGPNPPATIRTIDKSVHIACLPYLEENGAFESFNFELSVFSWENTTMFDKRIAVFACPSDLLGGEVRDIGAGDLEPHLPDIDGRPWRIAMTSYSFNFGTLPVQALAPLFPPRYMVPSDLWQQVDGVFNDYHPIRFSDIRDGLTNTIFASEKSVGEFPSTSPDSLGRLSYGWYLTGNFADSLFCTTLPPNLIRRLADKRFGIVGASSNHPGGVNVVFGDGSVRFVNDSISCWNAQELTFADGKFVNIPQRGIWQMMATRAGDEVFNTQDY